MTVEVLWEERIGSIRVFEHPRRKRVLYLRWRSDGNWAYLSLAKAAAQEGFPTATLSDVDGAPLTGRALDRRKKWALAQAEAHLAKLRSPEGAKPATVGAAPRELTLGDSWDLVSNPDTGKYPVVTRHRKEVERELQHAVRILGADQSWTALKLAQLTKLWRTRIRELRVAGTDDEMTVGLRGAEITISRLLAVATWLRDHEHIPADASIAPSSWRQSLRNDWLEIAGEERLPEPARPRHTAENFRDLFAAAWEVDPRLGLMYSLGAELRGGQIKRARRSDLDLTPARPQVGDYGRFRSPGRGKKKGAVVELTKGQRADVDRAMDRSTGYLRELEGAYERGELKDYFLFPRGQMPGGRAYRRARRPGGDGVRSDYRTITHPVATIERHVDAHVGDFVVRKWFKAAEQAAGITSVKGRVWYGTRRQGVDLAKESGISREALQEHGGWSDSQVPDAIYADKDRDYARKEAAQVRAKIRGEGP